MKINRDKTRSSLILLLFLIVSLPLGVVLVGRKIGLPRAVELPSPIFFAPDSGSHEVGEEFTVNVALNTEEVTIDGLDVFIEAVNLDIKGASKADLPSNLFFIKNPVVSGSRVSFSVLSDPINRFKNNEARTLVSLTVLGKAHCAESKLSFNPDLSVVASVGENILGNPQEASFDIQSPSGITNPEFTSPSSATAPINQPFSYTATATNPNNGTLVYTYSNLPSWLVAEGATISGTPTASGTFTVGIIVEDGRGGSACLTLAIEVIDQEAIEISWVTALPVSHQSAGVFWLTNRPATSQVEYGTTTAYGSQTGRDETLVEEHIIALEGLEPETLYHFRVKSTAPGASGEAVSSDYTFRTLTEPSRVLNVLLRMEGKPNNRNNYPVSLWAKGTTWRVAFTPNSNGRYPVSLEGFPESRTGAIDFLLKGYQHLQVKRVVEITRDGIEFSADFGILPAGDIAPRNASDNYVNVMDYSILVSEWNLESARASIGDFNADYFVNSIDYSIMVNNFHRQGNS